MTALTPSQSKTLRFILEYRGEHGYAPTLREIASHLGVSSVATVHQHVRALEKKGAIEQEKYQVRAIVPIGGGALPSPEVLRLPLYGSIPASPPVEAWAQSDNEVEVPRTLVGIGEHFALSVSGESMIEAGIHDGDIVVVKRQPTARDGQTAAILLDGEVTLKRIYRDGARVELRPANAAMQSIFVERGDLTVQGIVVALLRKYPAP